MKINYENKIYDCNEEWSSKIFTAPQIDLPNDIVVYSSSFYQENLPDSHVFPEDLKGVTFLNCNLDNVVIPEGNVVIGGTQRRIKIQNDLNDWEINENHEPVKPLNSEIIFVKFGLPVPKPEDIPAERAPECIDLVKIAKEIKVNQN